MGVGSPQVFRGQTSKQSWRCQRSFGSRSSRRLVCCFVFNVESWHLLKKKKKDPKIYSHREQTYLSTDLQDYLLISQIILILNIYTYINKWTNKPWKQWSPAPLVARYNLWGSRSHFLRLEVTTAPLPQLFLRSPTTTAAEWFIPGLHLSLCPCASSCRKLLESSDLPWLLETLLTLPFAHQACLLLEHFQGQARRDIPKTQMRLLKCSVTPSECFMQNLGKDLYICRAHRQKS